MKDQLLEFQRADKKVKLSLRNGFNYTGKIISISDGWLQFRDKFGLSMSILISDITSFGEVAE